LRSIFCVLLGKLLYCAISSVCVYDVSTNINQIAKRANTTGNIYAADLNELRGYYDEIWGRAKVILQKLADL
jgi:hypothetical protein